MPCSPFLPRRSGKSDAIFESREQYIVRFFRAMTFYARATQKRRRVRRRVTSSPEIFFSLGVRERSVNRERPAASFELTSRRRATMTPGKTARTRSDGPRIKSETTRIRSHPASIGFYPLSPLVIVARLASPLTTGQLATHNLDSGSPSPDSPYLTAPAASVRPCGTRSVLPRDDLRRRRSRSRRRTPAPRARGDGARRPPSAGSRARRPRSSEARASSATRARFR